MDPDKFESEEQIKNMLNQIDRYKKRLEVRYSALSPSMKSSSQRKSQLGEENKITKISSQKS
jgi:small-conductance mechanosensitive channel